MSYVVAMVAKWYSMGYIVATTFAKSFSWVSICNDLLMHYNVIIIASPSHRDS